MTQDNLFGIKHYKSNSNPFKEFHSLVLNIKEPRYQDEINNHANNDFGAADDSFQLKKAVVIREFVFQLLSLGQHNGGRKLGI